MQGLFSGVWGVSSVIGPLIGGFLVDQVAWQWVFYINVVPVLLAVGWCGLPGGARPTSRGARRIDYPGAAFADPGGAGLLLGLDRLGTPQGWAAGAAVGTVRRAVLGRTARRRPDPAAGAVPRPAVCRLAPARRVRRVGHVWQPELCAAVCPGGAGHQRHPGRHRPDAHVAQLDAVQHRRRPAAAAKVGYRTLALVGMLLLVLGILDDASTKAPAFPDVLYVADGRGHGPLHPGLSDRRAEYGAAPAGRRHQHPAVQPQHRRHLWRQHPGHFTHGPAGPSNW
jgi:hypothetical protein